MDCETDKEKSLLELYGDKHRDIYPLLSYFYCSNSVFQFLHFYFLMEQVTSVSVANGLQLPQQLHFPSTPLSHQHKFSSDLAWRAFETGLWVLLSSHPYLPDLEEYRRLEPLCSEDRLRELGLSSLEERRLHKDLIVAFQYLQGSLRKLGTDFLVGPVVTGQGVMI